MAVSNTAERAVAIGTTERSDDQAVLGLVQQAQAGDMAAFDELVMMFRVPMFNLAYRMVNNREDADELTQEIFLKLYKSIGRFEGRSKFSTWLYAVAANTCRSGLRKLKRISSMEVVRLDDDREGYEGAGKYDPPDSGDLPSTALEREEVKTKITELITELPEDFRMVIVMRDIQGMAYEEMAEALSCSVGTIKSRLSRGRARLKEKLTREGLVCAVKT